MARFEKDGYLMGAVEALLFVSDEPVSERNLSRFLEEEPAHIREVLQALKKEYESENRGMQLREVAGGWRFYSHPAYHDVIEEYIVSWDTRRLSQAALEALAVIAYHQPVTRAGVNAIRGVNSEAVVSSLIEKGLVKEVGREKSAGAAILYGTTRSFLEKFGLKSLHDLPPLEDYAPDEASREFIRQRLSGVRAGVVDADIEDEDLTADLNIVVTGAAGEPAIQEVDRGEDERVDDAEAMGELLRQAMTEKVDEAMLDAGEEDE